MANNVAVNPAFRETLYNATLPAPSKSAGQYAQEFLTMGVSSAALSAGLSFYNTIGTLASTLVGEEFTQLDTYEVLKGMGANQTAEYYDQHRQGIDAVGFVAGSFIPGTLAIKGLRATQVAASGMNTTARLSTGIRKALVPDNRAKAFADRIHEQGKNAADVLQADKLRTIAAGFHQQALEAAAFEGAVLLTMNQAPTLNGEDMGYFESIASNLDVAAAGFFFGTAIGGTIQAAVNVGALKAISKNYQLEFGIPDTFLPVTEKAGLTPTGSAAGFMAQKYLDNLEFMKTPEYAALPAGRKADIESTTKTARLELDRLVLETSNNDVLVRDALVRLVVEGKKTPDEILANVKEFRSISQRDILQDGTIGQVDFVGEGEYEAWLEGVNKTFGTVTTKQERNANGISLNKGYAGGVNNVRGVARISRLLDEAASAALRGEGDEKVKAIFDDIRTFRHETGHNLLQRAADDIKALSKTGAAIIKEAEALSRIVRKDQWDLVDRIKAYGIDAPEITKDMKDPVSYMNKTEELLADAYAYLTSPSSGLKYDDIRKQYPALHKLFVKNKVLAARLTKGREILSTQTGELVPTRINPTAADITKGGIKLRGDTVLYGEGKSIRLGEYDFTKLSPIQANALFAVSRTRTDIKAGQEISFFDLPALTAAKVQNIPVKVVYPTEGGGSVAINDLYGVGDNIDDIILLAKTEVANKLKVEARAAAEAKKIKAGEVDAPPGARPKLGLGGTVTEPSGSVYDDFIAAANYEGRPLSDKDIARMIDTGEEFVLRTSLYERLVDPSTGFKGLPVGAFDEVRDQAFFSIAPGYDPTAPLHVVVMPDRNSVLNGSRIKSLVDARQRANVYRNIASTSANKYFQSGSVMFPDNAAQTGINPALNVTSVDSTSGVLASANQNYGIGGSFFQMIGNAVARLIPMKSREVDDFFDSSIVKLAADEGAVYEAAVLESVIRQAPSGKGYRFVPSTTQEFLARYGDDLTPEFEEAFYNSGLDRKIWNVDSLGVELPVENKIWRGEIYRVLDELAVAKGMDSELIGEQLEELHMLVDDGFIHTIKNDGLVKHYRDMVKYNSTAIVPHRNTLSVLTGGRANLDPEEIYLGPADTRTYPHHALVSFKAKGIMGQAEVGMIVAQTPELLQKKIADAKLQFGEDLEGIYTKQDIKKYKEAQAEYESSKLFRNESVNSTMMRKGILWDATPQPNPDIFNNHKNAFKAMHGRLVRGFVEAKYAEEFATLDLYSDYATRFVSNVGGKAERPRNTYADMKRMALGLRSESTDNIWNQINTITDGAISKALYAVRSLGRGYAEAGDSAKMNALLEEHGMKALYNDATPLLFTNVDAPTPVMEKAMAKANYFISTGMLRLDGAHAIVNAASLPIMLSSELSNLRKFSKADRWEVLRDGTSVKIPGTDKEIFGTGPLIMQAVKDLYNKPELMRRYKDRGIVFSNLEELRLAETDVSKIPMSKDIKDIDNILTKAINIASKPVDWSEEMARFIAARAADIITDTLQVPESVKWATINTFVNRVNGNYVASQRPTLFQGWMGQALGLFQTYQFNLIQSLFSNIQSGNGRGVAAMLTAQASIFGAQSLPGFQAVNEYIGKKSSNNSDFYTTANTLLGEDIGNWLLYGTASSAAVPLVGNGVDLYSRGDLTPRTPIILPMSPMETPVAAVSTKVIDNVLRAADRVFAGAPIGETFVDALAHNGLNRPIQSLAQLAQGARTTAGGQVLVELETWDAWNLATRALGTRPLDEAVAVSAFYRTNAYKAAQQQELNSLGDVYRMKVRAGVDTREDYYHFAGEYAAMGGNIENFSRWIKQNYQNATQGQIDRLRENNNSREGRYLQSIMGADVEDSTMDGTGWFGQ